MTAGERHERGVKRLVDLFTSFSCKHIYNDSGPHGLKGWKLPYPVMLTEKTEDVIDGAVIVQTGLKPYSPISDCMIQFNSKAPFFFGDKDLHSISTFDLTLKTLVSFEVDGDTHLSNNAQAKDYKKAEVLKAFNIQTIRFTIDEMLGYYDDAHHWHEPISDIQIIEETAYWLRKGETRRI